MAENVSFASPLADARYAQIVGNESIDGLLGRLGDLSWWSVAFTLLCLAVAYDQSKCHPVARSIHARCPQYFYIQGGAHELEDMRIKL
jgi:hypothetical protein